MITGRQLIAYHEAGHAAVTWLTGYRVVSARIWLTGKGWRGMTYYGHPTSALRVAILAAEVPCPAIEAGLSVVGTLAAGLAEELLVPRAVYDGPDRKGMVEFLRDVWGCETPDERARVGRPLATIAAALVGLCRPQVEALAEVLMVAGAVDQANIRRILGPRIMPPAWVVGEVVAALIEVDGTARVRDVSTAGRGCLTS